jgi:hypothetical protein
MTTPTQHLRSLRGHLRKRLEQRQVRRLAVAKALRESCELTNIALGKMFNVTRETIALDRKAIVEELIQSTKTETELLRDGLIKKLEALEAEVQLHRKDGKLPFTAIDQILAITKTVIELTGARRAVVETKEYRKLEPITFATTRVGKAPAAFQEPTEPPFVPAEVVQPPRLMTCAQPHPQAHPLPAGTVVVEAAPEPEYVEDDDPYGMKDFGV